MNALMSPSARSASGPPVRLMKACPMPSKNSSSARPTARSIRGQKPPLHRGSDVVVGRALDDQQRWQVGLLPPIQDQLGVPFLHRILSEEVPLGPGDQVAAVRLLGEEVAGIRIEDRPAGDDVCRRCVDLDIPRQCSRVPRVPRPHRAEHREMSAARSPSYTDGSLAGAELARMCLQPTHAVVHVDHRCRIRVLRSQPEVDGHYDQSGRCQGAMNHCVAGAIAEGPNAAVHVQQGGK
jgi:hypothetical protein